MAPEEEKTGNIEILGIIKRLMVLFSGEYQNFNISFFFFFFFAFNVTNETENFRFLLNCSDRSLLRCNLLSME